jgi:hypothetical protein
MTGRGESVAIAAAVVTFLPLLLIACSQAESEPSQLRTVAIEPYIEIATPLAMEWADDAYLVGARLPLWLEPKMATSRVSLSFRSENNRSMWLLVIIKGTEDGSYMIQTEEGLFDDPRPQANPANMQGSRMSSEEAAEILSKQDVIQFFRENHRSMFASLVLDYTNSYTEQEPLIWSARLSSPGTQRFLTVEIDANSGQLIRSFDPSNPEDAP